MQALAPTSVPGLEGNGPFIVHGDYGPQNMLFDIENDRVTSVVDWESAHLGDRVEDLAGAEWLIRMHHPEVVDMLDALFVGAQQRPPWKVRHDAMLRQVREILMYCEEARQPSDWHHRLELTERWSAE